MKNSLLLFLLVAVPFLSLTAKDSHSVSDILSTQVNGLLDEDFAKREDAMLSLLALSEDYLDEVLTFLWSPQVAKEPELVFRRKEILEQVFKRSELGIGRASTGIVWGRLLYFDEEQLPAVFPLIEDLEEGCAAQKGGLKIADAVLGINGHTLAIGDPLPSLKVRLAALKSEAVVELTVRKCGRSQKNERRGWIEAKQPLRTVKFKMGPPINTPIREEEEGEFDRWREKNLDRLRLLER